jgi:hypothetical protein
MGEKALVESQVADAIALVQKLDAEAAPPSLAVWYFYDDASEWRLLLAGPTYDALLPRQEAVAYRKIVDAMAATAFSSLSISDVKLINSQSSLPRAIRILIKTPSNGIAQAHFTDTTLNGIFIKEMIVLRSA